MPSTSTSKSSSEEPVRLKLIWKPQAAQEGGHHCFNESLFGSEFHAWKQRLHTKLQTTCSSQGALQLRWVPNDPEVSALPLETEEDFRKLQNHYLCALSLHQAAGKPTTFRIVVVASPAPAAIISSGRAGSMLGMQPRRQVPYVAGSLEHQLMQQHSHRPHSESNISKSMEARSDASKGSVTKSSRIAPDIPRHKGRRLSDCTSSPDHEGRLLSLSNAAVASEVCWVQILWTIVKTVDRHHFCPPVSHQA